ncbi:hypothetical protein ACLQ3C_06165 [Gordonia sp. DT30]|uniref:hypothetical protein n=1 Tax=Gordonia sp. DT30 TaxID=3416546 RepID=UPI003CE796AD
MVAAAALLFVQASFQPGVTNALQIGPIIFPDAGSSGTGDHGEPALVRTPEWAPPLSADDAVILIPGTTDYDGSDQLGRTLQIGLFGGVTTDAATGAAVVDPKAAPEVTVVSYPGAFGLDPFGIPIYLVGSDTFTHSVEAGSINGVADAEAAYPGDGNRRVVVNGYSQSAPIAMNVAYLLHHRNIDGEGEIPDDKIVVIIGADSRFPNTGVENTMPSLLPGLYTNGDRDPADTGDIPVYSYCVRGDPTCGAGNPLVNPISTFFYLAPGFYVHGSLNQHINEYTITKEWTSQEAGAGGNTHYIVYEGGNPWGMMLRDLGIPVPREFDEALSALVPVPMPGARSTLADLPIPMSDEMRGQLSAYDVPTPRELQELLAARLGVGVPVHDPDACARTPSACRADYSSVAGADTPPATTPANSTPTAPSITGTNRSATSTAPAPSSGELAATTSTATPTPETPTIETPTIETPTIETPTTESAEPAVLPNT